MAIVLTAVGAINNIYPGSPGSLNNNRKESVYSVIAELDYQDIFQNGAGTLHDNGVMRVDMQGTFNRDGFRWHNLQVQVDGVNGNSTVAHANVSEQTMTGDPANQRGVVKKVVSALNQSFDAGQSYEVTGTAP